MQHLTYARSSGKVTPLKGDGQNTTNVPAIKSDSKILLNIKAYGGTPQVLQASATQHDLFRIGGNQ